MGLSAIIITNRKSDQIRQTIESLSFVDEIIVVRDGVGDTSKNGKEVFFFHPLDKDFSAQRNFAISKTKNDWLLFVDDDELVTKNLAEEIKNAISSKKYSGYYLRRLDRYHNQILYHGETGNIKIIRLARKTAGKFVRPVHEHWQIKGPVGLLKNPLIHERKELVEPFINRIIKYSPIDAQELGKEGKPYSTWRLLANPMAKFIFNYLIKLGFLDGYAGLFQAYLMSVQSLTVRIFQWQKY